MFKKIKMFFSRLSTLENRIKELEQTVNVMWEETHPRTMGGK